MYTRLTSVHLEHDFLRRYMYNKCHDKGIQSQGQVPSQFMCAFYNAVRSDVFNHTLKCVLLCKVHLYVYIAEQNLNYEYKRLYIACPLEEVSYHYR